MTRPGLHLERLREHFDPRVFERGRELLRNGDVQGPTRRGSTVSARVRGSEARPYRVTFTLEGGDLGNAECSCPYGASFGGYCKHIAAVALTYLDWPELVADAATLGDLLDPLNTGDLRGALEHLLDAHPELMGELELYLQTSALLKRTDPVERANSTPTPDDSAAAAEVAFDTRPFEKLMRAAVQSSSSDYDGYPEYGEVYKVIAEAGPLLARAAYREALAVGEALVRAFIDEVNANEYDYEGIGFSDEGVVGDLDAYLAEAVLGLTLGERPGSTGTGLTNTGLTDTERKRLLHEVFAWNDQVDNEWTDPSFGMTAHALAEGFENPDEEEAKELTAEAGRLELSRSYPELRLRVLRRSGRSDEALSFAAATGQGAAYLAVLLEQGQVEQVMSVYRERLKGERDALSVAQLLAADHPERALELAQYGLTQDFPTQQGSAPNDGSRWPEFLTPNDYANDATRDRLALASFTKELAGRLGAYEVTLSSSLTEFGLSASLPRYEALRALVGADWPRVRAQLHDLLRRADYGNRHAAADIFLHEGLPDDAVGVASRFSGDDALLHKVMNATMDTHAPWIIATARKRAEPVMDGARSNHYREAAASTLR